MSYITYVYDLHLDKASTTDTSSTYSVLLQTPFYYDSSKYVNPTFYLEVRMYASMSSTAYVELESTDDGGYNSTKTSVGSSEISTTINNPTLLRSSAITLTNGKHYWAAVKVSSGGTISFYYARLVIVDDVGTTPSVAQSFITATPMYIATTGPSYSIPTNCQRITIPSGAYGGTVSYYLDALLYTSNAGYAAYAEIYNVTDSASVSGSEISSTYISTDVARTRSSSFTLTEGKIYTVRIHGTSGQACYGRGFKLVIQQTGSITAVRSNIALSAYATSSSTSYDWSWELHLYKYLSAQVSSPTMKLWSVVSGTSGQTAYADIYCVSTSTNKDAFSVSLDGGYNILSGTLTTGFTDTYQYTSYQKTSNVLYAANFYGICLAHDYIFYTNPPLTHTVTIHYPTSTNSTTSTSFIISTRGCPFYYDSSKYTNPKFRLNVNGYTTGAVASFILLQTDDDSSSSATTEISGSLITTTSTSSYTLSTSSEFSLTNGKRYWFGMKTSDAGSTTRSYFANLEIIDDIGATTPSVIESYANLGTCTNNSTNYANPNAFYPTYFYYDSSKYDGTINVYLEGCVSTSVGSNTGYVRLWNYTDGTEVSGSETTFTGTTAYRVRSSSFTLTTGKLYYIQVKSSDSNVAYVYNARLVIQQSGTITKTRSVIVVGGFASVTSSSYSVPYYSTRYNHNEGELKSPTMSVMWGIYHSTDSATAYMSLWDNNDSVDVQEFSKVVSVYVPYVEITTISPSLTDNHDYWIRLKTSATTFSSAGVAILLDTTFSSSVTTYTITKNSDAMAVLAANLKARYDMSTTISTQLKDLSGYANHGTAYGSVTIGGVTGINGNATDFDGADDYIDLGSGTSITSFSGNKISLVAWVNPDSLSTYFPIFYCTQYRLSVNTSGQVEAILSLGGTVYTKTFGSAGAVATGAWTQIAFTFDGTNWDVYINKTHQTTQTQTGTLDTTSNSVILGRKS